MMIPQRSKWLFDIGKNVSLNYASYFNIKPLEMPHAPADDHSFMEFGYDNCLFIQSAPATVIHSPQDTIENINFSYLTNVTKFILCFTTELANKNINLQVRITKPEEGSIYILKNKIINLPGFNTRKIGLRGLTIILGSAEVQINITSDEEILCVDYSIDGFYVGSSNKSPYNWKISGLYLRLFGKKTLGVRVTAISGKAAYDEMDIFIIKPNLNIWKLFPQRERWK